MPNDAEGAWEAAREAHRAEPSEETWLALQDARAAAEAEDAAKAED